MKANYLALIATYFISVNALAYDFNDADAMDVNITNNTEMDCRLTNQNLIHGTFLTDPPSVTIAPHDSTAFNITQITTLWGPDIIVDYQCGVDSISLEIQQDSTFVEGHTPNVTVLRSDELTIESTAKSASLADGTPGVIEITLNKMEYFPLSQS